MTSKRATSEQMDFLVSWLEDRPSMASGKCDGLEGRVANKKEWEELARSLNAIRFGTQKSGDKWQQSWRDLKTNAKKKASNLQAMMNRTEGALVRFPPLTPLDEKVLAIVGRVPIDGVPGEHTLYVTETEMDAPTCQVVSQSPGPVIEEFIYTGPELEEVISTGPELAEMLPGPSGIKRKASVKRLFGKRAISFDHRDLVATENTNRIERQKVLLEREKLKLEDKKVENTDRIEREKLLLERDKLKLEEKKVEKMAELGAAVLASMGAMLASMAAQREEDAKFRDGVLAELLKRKCKI